MGNRPFRHVASTVRVHYGAGCVRGLASEVERAGCSRIVVFCGGTLARSEPGLESVRGALGAKCVGAFTNVQAQSPVTSVEAAARLLTELNADGVVALGGGSAIVTARAASILAGEGGEIEGLATVFERGKVPRSPRLSRPKPKQFIIPTTPTTAYAKAGAAAAVPGQGRRLALFDPKARAWAIFFDSDFFVETPPTLFRDAAVDAFALGIQGLESASRNPMVDASLFHGLRLVWRTIVNLGTSVDDAASRGELMLAALMIGEASDHTGSGLASALGHMAGARYGVSNGIMKSIVLPHTLRYNEPATRDRLDGVIAALGLSEGLQGAAISLADACAALFGVLGLPANLQQLSIPRDELPLLAHEAGDDFFYFQNPRPVEERELLALLQVAW